MLTCSVRAAVVYGPGAEERLIPGLASRARRGGGSRKAIIVGDGSNIVDFVYAGNVAHAVVLAAQQLRLQSAAAPAGGGGGGGAGGAAVGGRAFFVTDDEPVPYGDFAGRVLKGLGYSVPAGAGMSLAGAAILAFVLRVLAMVVSPIVQIRPELTARRIAEEGKTQRFDVSNARKDLGYAPLWSQEVCVCVCVCRPAVVFKNRVT